MDVRADHKEGWVLKNRYCWIVVLEKTLEDPLDSREIKLVKSEGFQVWFEFNTEYSLEGLMLKLQYFGHVMQRANSLEKTLILVKIEGKRRRVQQRMRWLDGITDFQWTWVWASSSRLWRTGKSGVLQSVRSQRVEHDWETEQQQQQWV